MQAVAIAGPRRTTAWHHQGRFEADANVEPGNCPTYFDARRSSRSLIVMVECHLLGCHMPRIEAPAFALVVLVAVEAPARDPFAVYERAFVYRGDADLLNCWRTRLEGDAEAFAGADELVGARDHDEAEAA